MVVLGIGFAKCGTTQIAKLFDASENYTLLRRADGKIEIQDEIFHTEIDKGKNYFAKAPVWIWQEDSMRILREKFGHGTKVIINVRHPQEYLLSFYHMRQKQNQATYADKSFSEFIQMPMLGDARYTYYQTAVLMLQAIKTAVNLFGKENVIVIRHEEMCAESQVEKLINQGILISIPGYKFMPYNTYTKVDESIFSKEQKEELIFHWTKLNHYLVEEGFCDSMPKGLDSQMNLQGVKSDSPREVDAVYTWVQEDEVFLENYRRHVGDTPEPGRFLSYGEINYSVKLLLKFCPFIRNVYIVTNFGQRPEIVDEYEGRVRLIDHSEILSPECAQPTFNSYVIESFLHRIPNLSNNFLYFNDDMFVGNHISLSNLFQNEVPFADFKHFEKDYVADAEKNIFDWRFHIINANKMIAEKFGTFHSLRITHQASMMNKQACEESHHIFGQILQPTLKFRTRQNESINFVLLSQLLGVEMGIMIKRTSFSGFRNYAGGAPVVKGLRSKVFRADDDVINAHLNWKDVSKGNERQAVVRYRIVGREKWSFRIVDPYQNAADINGLQPDSTYEWKVDLKYEDNSKLSGQAYFNTSAEAQNKAESLRGFDENILLQRYHFFCLNNVSSYNRSELESYHRVMKIYIDS